jgi:uncharacterized membrane protein YedE/YeeE
MDFVPLIDQIGEPLSTVVVGAAIGLAFGVLAQRTAFCTRSAIIEAVDGRIGNQFPLWLIAFATAVLGVQYLLNADMISVVETRFFATPLSLSGAVIGGGLFGLGMILARGCASRLLVLGSSGNLRALVAVVLLGLTSYATLTWFLNPALTAINGLVSSSALGTNDLLAFFGTPQKTGLVIGGLLAALAIGYAVRRKFSPVLTVGGILVGAIIPAGWYLSYSLSTQVFEPFQADSLSYIRPFANSVILAENGFAEEFLSVDIGIVAGTIIGALVAAIASRSFRIANFGAEGAAPAWRYLSGAILMGFGGVLAAGCTIGAGFTGGSVLAVSSLLSLGSMISGAAIAHKLIDAPRRKHHRQMAIVPAE